MRQQRITTIPGPEVGGLRFYMPSVAAAAAANPWYNPLGSAAITARIDAGQLWAWRAQANDNVTWGAGPANYAASRIDEAQGVTLGENNGAVPWAGATGWSFTAASSQSLDTGIVPSLNPVNWIAFVQYANLGAINTTTLFGLWDSAGHNGTFLLQRTSAIAAVSYHGSTGTTASNAALPAAGNYAIAGKTLYRNSVADPNSINAGTGSTDLSVFLGALNFNANDLQFPTVDIIAFLLCDDATAFTAPDIAAIAADPGGSMHNL